MRRTCVGSVVAVLASMVVVLGVAPSAPSAALVPTLTPSARIAAGPVHTLVIGLDGAVYGAGSNTSGQLGAPPHADGVHQLTPMPSLPEGAHAVEVAAGSQHSVVRASNGKVYGIGNNTAGQVTGTGSPFNAWRELTGMPAGVRADAIAAGGRSTIVLANNGVVYGTGENDQGQLTGVGNRSTLTALTGLPAGAGVLEVAMGSSHVLVRAKTTAEPLLFGAGATAAGQLGGLAGEVTTLTPLPDQPASGIETMAAAGNRSAAIDLGGVAHGIDSDGFSVLPGAPSASTAQEIAAGTNHTMVLYQANAAPYARSLHGIGSNQFSQIGTGPVVSTTLIPVSLVANPTGLMAGDKITLAVSGGGLVRGSGADGYRLTGGAGTSGTGPTTLAGQPFAASVDPTIAGTVKVNQTVNASVGTWLPSGVTGPAPTTRTQWLIDGEPVEGATGASYQPTAADRGRSLSLRVSVERDGYRTGVFDTAGVQVAGIGTLVNTVPPSMNGVVRVGSVITGHNGSWDGTGSGRTYTYRWLRDGTAIPGATTSKYTPVADDLGAELALEVTAHAPGWDPGVAVAEPAAVQLGAFGKVASAIVVDEPVLNQAWSVNVTGYLTPTPSQRQFEWMRNGVVVSTTSASHFWPTSPTFAAGDQMSVRYTADHPGYPTEVWTSPTYTLAPMPPAPAPVYVADAPPQITGKLKVGQTLRVTDVGTADFAPQVTSLVHQWLRDGVPIEGANTSAYDVVRADIGARLSVRIVGSLEGRLDAVLTTAETAPVSLLKAPRYKPKGKPKIKGSAVLGAVLSIKSVKARHFAPKPKKLTYQWFRGTKAISGATTKTYKLKRADRGRRITVRISTVRPLTAVRTIRSKPTALIRW